MEEGSASAGRYLLGAGNSTCKGLTTGRPSVDRDLVRETHGPIQAEFRTWARAAVRGTLGGDRNGSRASLDPQGSRVSKAPAAHSEVPVNPRGLGTSASVRGIGTQNGPGLREPAVLVGHWSQK